jgi:DNA-directed RNA polymerase specialized sigma subunit
MAKKASNKRLLRGFLEDNPENIQIHRMWKFTNDNQLYNLLINKLTNHVVKIYFYSYILKSLSFRALEIKKYINILNNRESLSLNILEPEFNEEKITTIADKPVNYLEKICDDDNDFYQIITDENLLEIVCNLTLKQQNILLECVVLGNKEKTVAEKMGVSVQAINKSKKNVLCKIRKQWGRRCS